MSKGFVIDASARWYTCAPPPNPPRSALQQHCTIIHTFALCLPLSDLPHPRSLFSLLLISAICFPTTGIWSFFMGMSREAREWCGACCVFCGEWRGGMLRDNMFVGGRRCPETVSSRAVVVEDRGTSVCDIQLSVSLLLTHTHTHWCKPTGRHLTLSFAG